MRDIKLNPNQKYRKSPKGVLTNIYDKMRSRTKKKGFCQMDFTLADFHKEYLANPKYLKLYNAWSNNHFEKSLKPSIDRINPLLGYTKDNIQLKTWGENRMKADWEKSLVYTTAIIMFDENHKKIREFESIKEAELLTGIKQNLIVMCCQGSRKKTGGYIFEYRGDKFRTNKRRDYRDNPELLREGE